MQKNHGIRFSCRVNEIQIRRDIGKREGNFEERNASNNSHLGLS